MKTRIYSMMRSAITALSVVGLVAISGCDKDDPVVNPLIGTWGFTEALVAVAFDLDATGAGPMTQPVGTDHVALVNTILSAATTPPCQDAAGPAVQLTADNALFFVCGTTVDAASSGTWAESGTTLSLNIVSANLGNIPLQVTNVQTTATTITGTVMGFPFPLSLPQLAIDGALLPGNLQVVSFDITLTRRG